MASQPYATFGCLIVMGLAYAGSETMAARRHVDRAFAAGPAFEEDVEFQLTHIKRGRRGLAAPYFRALDGEETWRPRIDGVYEAYVGQWVSLVRRGAPDATRVIDGLDALNQDSFHRCPPMVDIRR